jgi:molybdopterin converting factor subunit 1
MTPGEIPIHVLLFGYYRELLGAPSVEVSLPAGARVEDLLGRLRQLPELAVLPDRPAVAVNRRYVDSSRSLSRGDEVALLPPVAGG